MLKIKHIAP